MKKNCVFLCFLVLSFSLNTFAKDVADKSSAVFFKSPKNNAVVSNPVKIKMGLKGMKVCEANKETSDKKCGHHHIIVDGKFLPAGEVIPKNETHMHFGQKQTEAELTLTPGKHTITLQFADYAHISMGEQFSSTITIEVKDK